VIWHQQLLLLDIDCVVSVPNWESQRSLRSTSLCIGCIAEVLLKWEHGLGRNGRPLNMAARYPTLLQASSEWDGDLSIEAHTTETLSARENCEVMQ
jgi:hypothetical protein